VRACARMRQSAFCTGSVLSMAKKLSMMALSQQPPGGRSSPHSRPERARLIAAAEVDPALVGVSVIS
jgi:hypothetical protein